MGHDDPRSRLLRSTASVAGPTLASRILGYVRDLLQAYFLGTGHAADAFTVAFAIPNLFRRLTGEGALTPAFIPTFTELKHDKGDKEAWRFGALFFWDLALTMAVITGLGLIGAPWLVKVIAYGFRDVQGKWDLTIVMTRIMFPYLLFVSLSALATGLLNSVRRFFIPAASPILFNIAVITAAALGASRAAQPALVFAAGVAAGGILQLALQLPFLWKEGMRFRPAISFRHPAVRRVGGLMIPGVLGSGVYQVNFALSRMIASGLEKGSASALYYASRIEELTLGLFSIALAAVLLPAFSEQAAARNVEEMKRTLGFALKLTSAVAIPAAVGLAALNRPIIRILFERGMFDTESTSMSAACLLFFAIGLPFVSAVKILAPVFFSLKDTRRPVVAGIIVVIVNIGGALVLMGRLRVGGLALALSLSQIVNFALLFFWLRRRIGPIRTAPLAAAAGRSLAAAALMGAVLKLSWPALGIERAPLGLQAASLGMAILAGILLYAGLVRVFSPRDFENLAGLVRRSASGGKPRPDKESR